MAKNNFTYDSIFTQEDKDNMIKDYVANELSLRDVKKKYGIKSNSYIEKILKPYMRTQSESNRIVHQRKPECFKHSEETKQKIREQRLKYMKAHPEHTAWRKRKEPSYPEKCFIKFLEANGYADKYFIEREKGVSIYSIDFAFVDEHIAVEIDGSQHWTNEGRKQKDELKDKLLLDNGWKVIRFTEDSVKHDWDLLKTTLDSVLNGDAKYERVGIMKIPKQYIKKLRNEMGRTEAQVQNDILQRKVKDRPTKRELYDMITTMSFVEIGKRYGVTDNTIRKWCKMYGLPRTKHQLNLENKK